MKRGVQHDKTHNHHYVACRYRRYDWWRAISPLHWSGSRVPYRGVTNNFQPGVTYVPDSTFWGLVSFVILGGIAVLGGIVAQFVAWIGAVINTNRLVDKTWFNILLWVGVAGIVLNFIGGFGALLGWVLMIVYLVGGPDGMAAEPMMLRPTAPVEPPRTLAPTG